MIYIYTIILENNKVYEIASVWGFTKQINYIITNYFIHSYYYICRIYSRTYTDIETDNFFGTTIGVIYSSSCHISGCKRLP